MSNSAVASDASLQNLLLSQSVLLLVSGLCWGIYLSVFSGTVWALFKRRALLSMPALVIYALFVLNVFSSIWENAVILQYASTGSPVLYSFRPRYPILGVVQDTTYFLTILLADSMMCWRLYVIWGRDKRFLILPAFFVLPIPVYMGVELSFDAQIVRDFINGQFPDDSLLNRLNIWMTVDLCSTLAFTVIVTILISGKLWWADRRMRQMLPGRARTPQYEKIIRSLIDSGALYSATIITQVATNWLSTAGPSAIVSYITSYVICLTPTLIVLRLNITTDDQSSTAVPMTQARPLASPVNRRIVRNRDHREISTADLSDISVLTNGQNSPISANAREMAENKSDIEAQADGKEIEVEPGSLPESSRYSV